MKYKYTSFYPPDRSCKWIKRPMISVEIFGVKESKKFDALLDSGADCSMSNVEIAELLGIDLSKAKVTKFTGISGHINGFRLEKVKIKTDGITEQVEIPVCFVDSPTVSILLGQEGFFDHHRIKFEKDHDTFEINSVRK